MPITDASGAKLNFITDVRTIRHLLFGHGFTYPEVVVNEETQNNKWHIVFECEYEEEYEPQA